MSDSSPQAGEDEKTQLRLALSEKTPRDEWPEPYRAVVEYFEEHRDLSSFESGGRYPHEADPFVLHESVRAPLRPDAEKEYNWSIMLNPWSGRERTTWIVDGEPLLPKETAHGAPDDDAVIASDKDLVEIPAHRVVVCVALTKIADFHTRGGTWLHNDDEIKQQFEAVLEAAAQNDA